MRKFGKVDKYTIIKKIIDMRIRNLKELFEDHILPSFKSKIMRIEKIKTDDDGYLEVLSDELSELRKNLNDISNLLCVGLYSRIESLMCLLGRHMDLNWPDKRSRWDDIIKEYNKRYINLSQINSYTEINILRLINNCVKHNESIIKKELQDASNNVYIEGKNLKLESSEVLSFFEAAKTFLYSLVDKINIAGKYN